jgi:hypothetical protein
VSSRWSRQRAEGISGELTSLARRRAKREYRKSLIPWRKGWYEDLVEKWRYEGLWFEKTRVYGLVLTTVTLSLQSHGLPSR